MNIYALPQLPLPHEITEILHGTPGVRIERIISAGQTSDWYDQSEAEFVVLVQGNAIIEYADGEKTKLTPGDTVYIPPRRRHRVAFTSSEPPCIWICVFFTERDNLRHQ